MINDLKAAVFVVGVAAIVVCIGALPYLPLLVTCPPSTDRIVVWHGVRPTVACVPR
jgi:hypothetical protein